MTESARHEVLRDEPGAAVCLLGNLAIVRGALEAGVQFVSGYPGTPASEVGDTFARIARDADVLFEYSVNEKIAVEIAFAASLAGARSLCSMKHLGLNYAGDPISTLPYVGVEGGLVIVSAGDPSAITSPNEQDQRHFTRFLYYPIFDPSTPDDAHRMTRTAFSLSEATRLPVILRPTTRVCHVGGMVELGPLPATRNTVRFTKNPARYVPIPVNARRMRTELIERYAQAEALLAESGFFPRAGTGRHGIVASGAAHAYLPEVIEALGVEERVSRLQIGAYPIPARVLADFLDSVDAVLVLEELTPFVEDWVTLAAHRQGRLLPIHGKRTGLLPEAFEYSPELVEDAVRAFLGLDQRVVRPVPAPELPPRPPVLCPGCPHRTSFFRVRRVFGKNTVYTNDIGCYTLGYGEPLHACDTLLCMGSSISQASGIARATGKRTVAFIGDSTFFHSGLAALANAVRQNDAITVCILNNFVTAMTGFQPSFTTDPTDGLGPAAASVRALSLERAVRGLGVDDVWSVDPFEETPTLAALRAARTGAGVNVVILSAPCAVEGKRGGRREPRPPFAIDPERCNACSLCVRTLGCPAIVVADGRYAIDPALCDGCALCAHVCQQDAIHPVPEDDDRN
ncbi:MAG: indolepyruvate ferredoxin oxidoreductase subunit alpha [Planctomycetes bacterium]|nr:indolepyruvate ferredoxin oxidoreductase subunit alpha [Planctomycetota bacterium]